MVYTISGYSYLMVSVNRIRISNDARVVLKECSCVRRVGSIEKYGVTEFVERFATVMNITRAFAIRTIIRVRGSVRDEYLSSGVVVHRQLADYSCFGRITVRIRRCRRTQWASRTLPWVYRR